MDTSVPLVDCSLYGKDSKTCLATVTGGKFVGKQVGIMAKYTDGYCICDMGGDEPMELIRFEHLTPWISVESVHVLSNGAVIYCQRNEDGGSSDGS